MRKSYLGRAEELTPQRLAEVATRLAGRHPAPEQEPAAPSRDESPPRQLDLAPDTGPAPDALLATKLFLPLFAVIDHRGRRSGRSYATSTAARPTADGFVIPLTFGERSDWFRNVRAVGGYVIRWKGAFVLRS